MKLNDMIVSSYLEGFSGANIFVMKSQEKG